MLITIGLRHGPPPPLHPPLYVAKELHAQLMFCHHVWERGCPIRPPRFQLMLAVMLQLMLGIVRFRLMLGVVRNVM